MNRRTPPSLAIGIVATLALFWLMQIMIMNSPMGLKETSSMKMVDFVRLKRETAAKPKERTRVREKPPVEKRPPPPPMQVAQAKAVKTDMPDIDMPSLDIPLNLGRVGTSPLTGLQAGSGGTGSGPAISTGLVPLVRIAPRYPMRAQMRRIEGWVKVMLTITPEGTVEEVQVVEAKPTGVFDREAIRAVKKWKFKPKIVDGQAVEQRAVQTLEFRLNR